MKADLCVCKMCPCYTTLRYTSTEMGTGHQFQHEVHSCHYLIYNNRSGPSGPIELARNDNGLIEINPDAMFKECPMYEEHTVKKILWLGDAI